MHKINTLTFAITIGTGCTPSVHHGLVSVQGGLAEIDLALERESDAYAKAVYARIDHCRAQDLKTSEERKVCMGPYGDDPSAPMGTLKDLYNQLAQAARAFSSTYRKVNLNTETP